MTTSFSRLLRAACVIAVMLSGATIDVSRAEVSAEPQFDRVFFLLISIGDGGPTPEPWPIVRLPLPLARALNEQGDEQGDGRPSAALDPLSGRLHVAWADAEGDGSHRVVISAWEGSVWSSPQALSDGERNAVDPFLHVGSDGTARIVWWEPSSESVVLREREEGSGAWAAPEVLRENGRFPATVGSGGTLFVGTTRPDGAGGFEVRLAHREVGDWSAETLDPVAYDHGRGPGDADLVLHERGGVVWADWLAGPGLLRTSRWDAQAGGWTPVEEIPCQPTADGRRLARFEAKRRALGF